MSTKVIWVPFEPKHRTGHWLIADYMSAEGINADEALDEIAKWCSDAECGTRMSYDMWKFKTKKELTAFLLRWS